MEFPDRSVEEELCMMNDLAHTDAARRGGVREVRMITSGVTIEYLPGGAVVGWIRGSMITAFTVSADSKSRIWRR